MNYSSIGILGANGRLGSELRLRGFRPLDCDITDHNAVDALINPQSGLKAVINCAAYTDVDGCELEENQRKVMLVHFSGVSNVAFACRESGIHLYHLSTDYIFAGKRGPYTEEHEIPEDEDAPVNYYGLSKLASEAVLTILMTDIPHTIIRTTGLYGGVSGRPDFLSNVINTLSAGKEMKVTNMLEGNQTYVPHLAKNIEQLVVRELKPKIINLGSKEVMSRYQFAFAIASKWGFDTRLLEPVANVNVPGWVAKRPTQAGLVIKLAGEHGQYGIRTYTVQEGLQEAYENWNSNRTVQ